MTPVVNLGDPPIGESPLHKPDFLAPWTDLGGDVAITSVRQAVDDGRHYPHMFWVHKRPDGHNCGVGHIRLEPPQFHSLISTEPLTIGGSLLCVNCGKHGFITAGKWVPA